MKTQFLVHAFLLATLCIGCAKPEAGRIAFGGTPVFAAFGDSITTGADSEQALPPDAYRTALDTWDAVKLLINLHDNPGLSWATGRDARLESQSLVSLAERFANKQYEGRNYAVSGARSYNLSSQLEAMKQQGVKPELVAVLIGGNDLCHPPDITQEIDVDTFSSKVSELVDGILGQSPAARITLVAIPKLGDLSGHGSHHVAGSTRTCLDLWQIAATSGHQLCNPYLLPPSPDAIAVAESSRSKANAKLAAIAAARPQSVHFAAGLADEPILSEDLSEVDCFHPSIAGQKKLAEKVFQSIGSH